MMYGAILALTSALLESAASDEATADTIEGVARSLDDSIDSSAHATLIGLARMHRVKAIGSHAKIAALAARYGHRFWSPVL